MKRAKTMSTITVELTIKVKTKFTSSNAEKTNEKTKGFISRMSEIFTPSVDDSAEVRIPNCYNRVVRYRADARTRGQHEAPGI